MKTFDNLEVFEQAKKCVNAGGIVWAPLNDNYTPNNFIYDFVLIDRNTKETIIFYCINKFSYKMRKFQTIPKKWYWEKLTLYTDRFEKDNINDICDYLYVNEVKQ